MKLRLFAVSLALATSAPALSGTFVTDPAATGSYAVVYGQTYSPTFGDDSPTISGDAADHAMISGHVDYAVPTVPEPASWALMIGGLGLVGGALRRRPAIAKVTFA